MMIVAKTKMKKIPDNCKKCSFSVVKHFGYFDTLRICSVRRKECPMERSQHKNMKYMKPTWCPLVEIE